MHTYPKKFEQVFCVWCVFVIVSVVVGEVVSHFITDNVLAISALALGFAGLASWCAYRLLKVRAQV